MAISCQTDHPIVQASTNPEDEVAGTVFTITEQELTAADTYELADYKRVSELLKSALQVWVYIRAL